MIVAKRTRAISIVLVVLGLTLPPVWCDGSNKHNSSNNNNSQQQVSEIWDQDLTDTFKIEGSDQGIQRVNLKCGSNSMNVVLETEKPFQGVMYTRGSFYKQSAPCFVKPSGQSSKTIEMNFNLDECQTVKEGDVYSNIVVIQNDPELITPGDSAFSLECDFRQPRNLNVEASMQARDRKNDTTTARPVKSLEESSTQIQTQAQHSSEPTAT